MKRMDGKVALVTGAAMRPSTACAELLAAERGRRHGSQRLARPSWTPFGAAAGEPYSSRTT